MFQGYYKILPRVITVCNSKCDIIAWIIERWRDWLCTRMYLSLEKRAYVPRNAIDFIFLKCFDVMIDIYRQYAIHVFCFINLSSPTHESRYLFLNRQQFSLSFFDAPSTLPSRTHVTTAVKVRNEISKSAGSKY